MELTISRRTLLKSGAGILSLSVLAPVLLSSCKKPAQASGDEKNVEPCPSDVVLSTEQIAIRNNLRYVDATPISTRTCDNCRLYTEAMRGTSCLGGCKIVPGPIHPKGYCISWLARM